MRKKGFRVGFVTYFEKNKEIFAGKCQKYLKKLGKGQILAKNRQKIAKKGENFSKNFKKSYKNSFRKAFVPVNQSKIVRPVAVAVLSFMVGFSAGKILMPVSTSNAFSQPESSPIRAESSILEEKQGLEATEIATLASVKIGAASSNYSVNTASATAPALQIPAIDLYTNVASTYVTADNNIVVPSYGVGVLNSYAGRSFTLLLGHRAGIFQNLNRLTLGNEITYQGKAYVVSAISQLKIENINMRAVTANSTNTIVLMTCAGVNDSERLIITATLK